jgi:S-adenosylmethionine synthetase
MLRTAESVSPKHPDKLCDQVSDAILDALRAEDPNARVAVEAAGGHGQLYIVGEVTANAEINYAKVARQIVSDELVITVNVAQQSPEIAQGVDTGGAGDQGVMVGYATAETDHLLPLEYDLARSLNKHIYQQFPYDGKTQITIDDSQIIALVASFQHATHDELQDLVRQWLTDKPHTAPTLHLNPAGDWDQGGFDSDAGLTGRKLAVDNYGPRVPIGGGAFSGKDATKVDRSGAYMARKVAVDYLRKHDANEVYVYFSYAIGVAKPVQATAVVDGTEHIVNGYDLTPRGIYDVLKLDDISYLPTAKWGHFGRDFSWD